MADRSLRFDLLARDKSFSKTLDQAGRKGQRLNRELSRTLGGAGDASGRRFSVGLNKRLGGGFTAAARMATRAVGLIGAAFAGIQVVGWLKGAIDEAREAAKVGRQTAAVIKATGGVANVTAKDVDRLAGSLMRKVAVDDDIIATGANMILTFKGVKNAAGANNDIFDQATAAAVDMTAAMNQGQVTQEGLQASSIRLGRALNDPIKGVSALTRVGVTFTQAQRDQIKALVEAGDTMGAQKIILAELRSEFGGAAKAAVDPWQRVGVIFGEVKEKIGAALLPVVDWLAVRIPDAIDNAEAALRTLKKWWDNNKTSVQILATILTDTFVPSVEGSDAQVRTFSDTLKSLNKLLTSLAVFMLEAIKVWLMLEHVTIGVISVYGSMTTAAGHVINAIDRLSGGTGHAGDRFVRFGEQIKDTARKELQAVRADAQRAQQAIDRLHGKNVDISGTTSLHFTKSFTASDWTAARRAAGRMATGGKIRQGTGPTADDVLIWASKGETVVPAAASKDPGFKRWAAAKGIPGFAQGGAVGVANTGQAHTGVAKMMDRWGTLQLAALVKSLVGGAGSAAIKSWIRAQDPKPYRWGAAGPGAFDCSGIVSAVLGKMLGMRGAGSGLRLFTTSSIHAGQYGLKSGLGGVLQIGVTPGRGHMAARYGGLGVEAESTRTGIKIGAAASRPESFARHYYHLARGGLVDPELLDRLARAGRLEVGGDPGRLRINGRVMDGGGWLRPGWNPPIYNGTGRPERVLP
ncbi:MAG TPA: hypothetical protein VHM23_09995, partial [Actinomycetota bacterium]|nr:hypothetical protein [Actinomycetota bacterium]